MIDIKRALISVSDKNGIIQFAQKLSDLGVEILSTGGTSSYLKTHGIKVTEVSDITNFPEILDGRVKTLHPKVHGAILAKAENIQHKEQLKEHKISKIDLVCVNLYPFELTISNPDCKLNDAIENIDIGGPAMIRAAAKNYQEVLVITDNNDYNLILEVIESNTINDILRLKLAQKAFNHTAYYDSIINNYLAKIISKEVIFAKEMTIPAKLVQELRYGENAHQRAAFYRDSGNIDGLLAGVEQLQGKELSYNNLVDSDTAWECVKQFTKPACVTVKHANPCAAAIAT
ncbi:MAG TPA: bifunctional phosphoribosylaminoimidazolecarboxamide formyltransferase/IMP cyclohydrolase, partial [Burkholderiales bacterium]|nr:bifunctional phosphoribosylaminoimidazolecarboxamide formyltransferase/IMP cyclohydrolase [Burkholderiales bacterium]